MIITFVFIASNENKLVEALLPSCRRRLKQWMLSSLNSSDVELAENQTILPESNFGWFWLAPANTENRSLISEAIEERYAVLVFGNVLHDCYSSRNPAQNILDAWISGGATKVRELEGCFSAAIADRIDGKVVLVGDIGGQRSLCYYTDERMIVASPHNIPLVATRCFPAEFDLVSASSIAAVGWSLGGKSLLKHVRTCHPAEYISWSDGRIQHISAPIIDPDKRIAKEDSREIARNLERIIETLRADTKAIVANEPVIKLELTSGADSRTVLSLLLSVIDDFPATKIIAWCMGEANSLEIKVARRLAQMYNIPFLSTAIPSPSPERFIDECDLLAFSMNGDSSIHDFLGYPSESILVSHGYAGELFRGYFYPPMPSLPFPPRSPLSSDDVFPLLRKKIPWLTRLPWKSPDLPDGVLTCLNTVIDRYAQISQNGYDILDLYNLYEAYALRGATRQRMTWIHSWSPFFNRQAIKLVFRMPPPICDYGTLHHEFLRRYTPVAYWMRINRRQPFSLERTDLMSRLISHLFKAVNRRYQRVISHIQPALNSGQPPKRSRILYDLRKDYLADSLMGTASELLISEGSFALELFGRHGVESLISQISHQDQSYARMVGYLIVMERWRTMVSAVARETAFVR